MRRTLFLLGVGSLLASQTACMASQSRPRHAWEEGYSANEAMRTRPGPARYAGFAEAEVYEFEDDLATGATRVTATARQVGSTTGSAPAGASAPAAPAPPRAPVPPPAPTRAKDEAPEPPSSLEASRGPMLVYTANIWLATFEAEAALAAVEKLAKENGGFLSKRERLAITIRVPAERFSETLQAIEKLGDVIDRNVSARDVTDEFFDLEARLRSARAVHGRLLALLDKASSVEESIAIEKELGRVLAEIERLEGRLKLLRDQLAYSTITANFRSKTTEIVGKKAPFRLPGEWLDQLGLGRLMRL